MGERFDDARKQDKQRDRGLGRVKLDVLTKTQGIGSKELEFAFKFERTFKVRLSGYKAEDQSEIAALFQQCTDGMV